MIVLIDSMVSGSEGIGEDDGEYTRLIVGLQWSE